MIAMTRVCYPISAILTIVALISVLVLYPQMPETVPIHWNFKGEVDGYGPRAIAFLLPGLMAGLLLLFRVLPWLSPKKFEVDSFRSTYCYIVVIIITLAGYIHFLVMLAYLGVTVNIARALVAGVFLMCGLLGNVLGKVRRNFYVGIRTPWTLASERVWNDTHRLGAWLFAAAGFLGFIGTILGLPLWLPLVLLMPTGLVPVVYSLIRYKTLDRRGEI
jgi:uncharacterized membrane protein